MLARLVRAGVLGTIVLLSACGGDAGDSGPSGPPPPDEPGSGTATIGPDGGMVVVDLGGGASARLDVPAAALSQPTTITLSGSAPTGPDVVAVTLEPDGLLLARAASLTVTLPSDATAGDVALAYRAGEALVPIGGRTGATGRIIAAPLASLGPYPAEIVLPAAGLRASRAGGATVVATPLSLQQRIAAAQQTLGALQTAEQPAQAEAAAGAFAALADLHETPGFRAATESLFQQWSSLSCQRYKAAEQAYAGAVTDAAFVFDGFVVSANRLLTWARQLAQIDDLASLPEVAIMPCDVDAASVVGVVEAKVPSVVQAADRIYSTVEVEQTFTTLLEGSIIKIIGAQAYLSTLNGGTGGGGLDGVVRTIWTRLRAEAFRQCRVGGAAYSRYNRMLTLMTENPSFGDTAPYAEQDLQNDLQVCGLDVTQAILSGPDAPRSAPPIRPGTAPGPTVLVAAVSMSPGDTLRLTGRLDALQCSAIVTSPEFNVESLALVLRRGLESRSVATLTRDASGRYLSRPADVVFDRDLAPLLTIEGAEAQLEFTRQGAPCAPDDYYDTRTASVIARVTVRRGQEPLFISTTALPGGTQGQPYTAQLAATGGGGGYVWSAVGLPPGLALNASTGTIAGTPTVPGSATVTVSVTSADGQTAQRTLTIAVAASPPPPPPPGTDPWVGTWRGTIVDRSIIPNSSSQYTWVLEPDPLSFDGRDYVSFPGTDFQCSIRVGADNASFTGTCGNPLNLFFNVRGSRAGSTITGLGDRPTTPFVDDFSFTLTK